MKPSSSSRDKSKKRNSSKKWQRNSVKNTNFVLRHTDLDWTSWRDKRMHSRKNRQKENHLRRSKKVRIESELRLFKT